MQLNLITITKNDIEGVKKTILSTEILREKYDVLQIVVDSSDEKIRKEIKQFLRAKKNIKYFNLKTHGISQAFNYGIKKSNEKWLWFLNGGDTVYKNADLTLVNNLIENVGSDMLIFEIVDKDGVVKHPKIINFWPPLGWVPHPATIIKKKCLEDVGCFDERYKIAMDGDLWIKLFSKEYIIDLVSIPLTNFAPNGLSSNEYETGKEIAKLMWNNKKILFFHWVKSTLETIYTWFYYTIKPK